MPISLQHAMTPASARATRSQDVEVLEGENGQDVVEGPGSHDAFLRQADQNLVDLS